MTSSDTSARLQMDSFRKILVLEESKGFQDTAVIGGLDRFLKLNGAAFNAILGDPGAAGAAGAPYTRLTPSQRQERVKVWLARLEAAPLKGGHSGPDATAGDNLASPASYVPPPAATPRRSPSAGGLTPAEVPSPGRSSVPSVAPLESPVNRLRGVDTKLSARLKRLGVSTIRDLLYLFPRRHSDFSTLAKVRDLVPGEERTLVATVWEARETSLGKGRLKATEAVVSDETGNVKVVWFGQPYLARLLKPNSRVAISGRVDVYKGQIQFQSPEFELLDRQESLIHTGRLVPVYALTEGLTPRKLRSIVWQALEDWAPRLEDFLPDELRERAALAPLREAIMQAHYPADASSLEAARRRLAFDELFLIQIAVLMRRRTWQEQSDGVALKPDPGVVEAFRASLPFTLTDAQDRCLGEVLGDMMRGAPPMNRILQGEVGSGKTAIALAALLATVASGYQGSIMVPTEVLAEQHFATVSQLLGGQARPVQEEALVGIYLDPLPRPISVGLLMGSTRGALKRELQRRVSEGTVDIVIGTHALIQERVEMPRLALAVVDEQQRFGVMQRAALRQKGGVTPHVLVMSATPIPRTLALTLYGDLDISTIDQLPPGRQRVLTRIVPPGRRAAAYGFVRKQVADGRQAFVICPLIDESEAIEARAATEEYQRLSRDVFPDLRLGLLHGRMGPKEKDDAMRRFRDGEVDILVSTPVVEVGIDVPNATVMLVEGAHRFGLSQLHQFRGRVGRGPHKSYCLLLSEHPSAEAGERLSALERIHDGFELAEVDLGLRGPGDYFGTRQSGLPSLRMARLSDRDLLGSAREEAARTIRDDPDLKAPWHTLLAGEASRLLDRVRDEVS